MKKTLSLVMCLMLMAAFVTGCGGADETKPIAEVKTEAKAMDVNQLQSMVAEYQKAIEAKKPQLEELQAKLKEIPFNEMMGPEAKALQGDIADVTNSIKALTDRLNVYVSELKAKGGTVQ